jgi:hypothetical protein
MKTLQQKSSDLFYLKNTNLITLLSVRTDSWDEIYPLGPWYEYFSTYLLLQAVVTLFQHLESLKIMTTLIFRLAISK